MQLLLYLAVFFLHIILKHLMIQWEIDITTRKKENVRSIELHELILYLQILYLPPLENVGIFKAVCFLFVPVHMTSAYFFKGLMIQWMGDTVF